MDCAALRARLPAWDRFDTVEEMDAASLDLARRHPRRVQVFEAGRSRRGAPLLALRIGRGARHALCFGCPHPNEPVGVKTIEALAGLLAEQPEAVSGLDYTWTLIKCVDPDGTRLNQGWFHGPFTVRRYARHFYRPPFHQQVEWTFPFAYGGLSFRSPLPETRALMRLIEDARPALMCPLHNAGFGGAYFYVSRPCPPLYPRLHAIVRASGLPAHVGEPEVPYAVAVDRAIYLLPTRRQACDFYQAQGIDPAAVIGGGASSADFAAERAGTFTLISEVPYFDDPQIASTSVCALKRRDTVLEGIAVWEEVCTTIGEVLAAEGVRLAPTPHLEAVAEVLRRMPVQLEARLRWAQGTPDLDRPATVAERFHARVVSRFYAALTLGMLVRAVEEGGGTLAAGDRAREAVERCCAAVEEYSRCRVVAIRDLVAVQLASIFAAAESVQHAQQGPDGPGR